MLLVALGRTPQTEQLGLEDLGFEAGKYVEADEHCQVPGHPWLYAIGDVNGRALFTHMGKYQARVAADHVLGRDTADEHGADGPLAPRVIFSDPQVAAVGHTAETAEEAGIDVEIVDVETSGNAGGSFWGRNAPGTSRLRDRQAARRDRRRDVHRRRGPGLPPRGDDRDRRRGAASTACATPSRRSRRAARSGSTCSRPGAAGLKRK